MIADSTALQQTVVIRDCCQIAFPAVFEILHSKRIRVTILFPVGHFLLVVLWNQASLSLAVSEMFNGEHLSISATGSA